MRFRVLGPVAIIGSDGQPVALGSQAQRTVLARLLCTPNRAVTPEQLIDALWGHQPPASAQQSVRVYLHHLRRRAGIGDLLLRDGAGITLAVGPEDLDANEFERLTVHGRDALGAGQHAQAARSLRAALGLWYGSAYSTVAHHDVIAADLRRLEDLRVTALEDRFEAELYGSHPADLVPEIKAATVEHPLRERLRGQLIRALSGAGRQAEAVQVYDDIRRVLAEELGVDPGSELQALHVALLRGQQPAAATPAREASRPSLAYLPPDKAVFSGRTAEIAWLMERIAPAVGLSTAARPLVICGPGGVGKTALAVHVAHRVRGAFPDGQLYVNLRGFDPAEAVSPMDALASLLHMLGVERSRVPDEADRAAAMLRDAVSGRRILFLLDNAATAEQIRPLLPAESQCAVLITSRNRLSGLVATNGALRLELAPLTNDEAVALLADFLADDRVEADPAGAARVAVDCGHLPLAICIAAASLLDAPHRKLADYSATLHESSRLDVLSLPEDPANAVRAVFDLSVDRLPPTERRTLRLVGLSGCQSLSTAAVAALLDTDVPQAHRTLDRLLQASLVETLPPDRFACHDLLRLYARELSVAHDPPEDRATAIGMLVDHYVALASAADGVLRPTPGSATPADDLFGDPASAVSWFDIEYANISTVLQHCTDREWHRRGWQLSRTTRGYLRRMHRVTEWERVYRIGLAAAEADGDAAAAADLHDGLADLYFQTKQWADARNHWTLAAAGFGSALDHYRQALCHDNIGMVELESGDPLAAERHHLEALSAPAYADRPKAAASTYIHLGIVYGSTGRYDECRTALALALELSTQAANWEFACFARHNLAELARTIGDHATAHEHALAEIKLADEVRLPIRSARGHELIAEIFTGTDNPLSRDHLRHALAIYEALDHPNAELVRTQLRALP